MSEIPINLDAWRDPETLRKIKSRRIAANKEPGVLRICTDEIESLLLNTTAVSTLETLVKAKYLIQIFSATKECEHPTRQALADMTVREIDVLLK